MATAVHFVHLAKTKSLEDYVHEKIDPLLAKFLGKSDLVHHVRLKMENSPHQAGPDLFQCEILVQDKKLGKAVHVLESSQNMYQAIADASHRLKYLLVRYKEKTIEKAKRLTARNKHKLKWMQGNEIP